MSESPTPDSLPTSAFDYVLPRELIALHPAARRDESRLLVVHREGGRIEHRRFREIIDYASAGDAIVLNETRVFPARLRGRKPTGAQVEVLLLHPWAAESPAASADTHQWTALVRPGGKLRPGTRVIVSDELHIEIEDALPDGRRIVHLSATAPLDEVLARHGEVPLPPYIARAPDASDVERYQTVYARDTGSVAAPTAGLHFTAELLEILRTRGVHVLRLVLHVGIGTFRPVEVENPAEHAMHAERYQLSSETTRTIEDVRARGHRAWAVGTTVARTLESCAREGGHIEPGSGWTSLFIRPPWRFRAVDALLTNFHLPRSTLLMLVAAFAGHDLVMRAYAEAVERKYRFYSYGDAMLIL